MANEYKVRLYSTDGFLRAEITDFQSLAYTKKVNAPGIMTISLSGSHLAISEISRNCQFEVWRRPEGQVWARDFIGITRKWKWGYKELPLVIYTAPGIIEMLRWRINAWYANTSNRTIFISRPAETIANTIVKYNLTTSASVGRLRSGIMTGVDVETDGAAGNTIDWACAYDNVLKSLQELCAIGGGDFDLVKLTSTTYEWRWYVNQLGTDKSSTVIFAMERGNMAEPEYEEDYIPESTAGIVGGKGEDSNRAYVIRTGGNYDVNTNNTETFIQATNCDTTAGLQAAGDAKLSELKAIKNFTFKVQQAPACLYGVHYFLGDLVSAINPFTSSRAKYKINEVTVSVDKAGNEVIDVEAIYNGVYIEAG